MRYVWGGEGFEFAEPEDLPLHIPSLYSSPFSTPSHGFGDRLEFTPFMSIPLQFLLHDSPHRQVLRGRNCSKSRSTGVGNVGCGARCRGSTARLLITISRVLRRFLAISALLRLAVLVLFKRILEWRLLRRSCRLTRDILVSLDCS